MVLNEYDKNGIFLGYIPVECDPRWEIGAVSTGNSAVARGEYLVRSCVAADSWLRLADVHRDLVRVVEVVRLVELLLAKLETRIT